MAQLSPDEKALNSFLDQVDGEASSHRKSTKFDQRAEAWAKLRDGESWGAREEPIFAANVLGNLHERKIATLTQSKPDIMVSSRDARFGGASRVLTDTIAAILAEQAFDAKTEIAADLAGTFGWVAWNTAWDPFADFGKGDIVIKVLDPRRIFIDHRATDPADLQRAQYMVVHTPMSLADIRATWPDRGPLVKPDEGREAYEGAGGVKGALSRISSLGKRPLKPFNADPGPYPWATVKEYWLRSDRIDPLTGKEEFPAGRVVHRAGDVILDDGPNPYWDGWWPIDVWDWRTNFDSHMGRSDIEAGRKLQETLNRVGNAIAKGIILTPVNTIIVDEMALKPSEFEKLDNRAARIIKKQQGRSVEFTPAPPIPGDYLTFVGMTEKLIGTMLGIPDALQGNRQQGVVAASAVEGLQTAAETLVRASARRLEYVVERIGTKLISRVIQFYTGDRVLLTTGPDERWKEYTFIRDKIVQTDQGQPLPPDQVRDFFQHFRFKVTPLSSLPQNRTQRGLMALQLYQAGVIDHEEVLRTIDWPNWKDMLPKIQQQKAQEREEAMKLALMGINPKDINGGTGSPVRSNRRGTSMRSN